MALGKFITFEGGEGVGKSTQIRLLAERLAQNGIDCIQTREPGGSSKAEAVRELLLSGTIADMGIPPSGEAVLFAAARADHVDTKIRPALEQGQWVLCDRFMDSTRIYQGENKEVSEELVNMLERLAIDGVKPDITFILDLRAEIGMARANSRRAEGEAADRFEREDLTVHENRRNAFLSLAHKDPQRCKIVDASQSIDEIAQDIWQIVERALMPKEQGAKTHSKAPSDQTAEHSEES